MLLSLLALLLSTVSVAGAAPFAYVSYSSSAGGRVAVIDADPNAACLAGPPPPCVVRTLEVGAAPVGVAVNPAGTFAYVANAGDNTVSVIRTSSNPSDIAVLPPIPNVGFGPWGVAVSPDSAKVYVGLSDGSVAVIDANNLYANPTPRITNVGGFLNGIVAVGSRVYVSDSTNRQVVVIDGPTQRVIKEINVGSPPNSNTSATPVGLVANPNGTRVYVADLKFDDRLLIDVFEVSGIDVALLEVVETFVIDPYPLPDPGMADNTLAAPGGIAISPDGKKLYVANDGLEVFDPATRTMQNDVTIITLANGNRDHVNVGTTPVGVATDPTGLAYVANRDSGTVSVIDPSTNTLVKSVSLGGAPSVFGAFATAGPPQFTLTLMTVGGGSITAQPSSATGKYDAGRGVMLTATPDANSQFTGWSGDCSGTSITCTVTMDAAKSVTATFTPQYTLFVTTLGSGTVTAQPASTPWKYLAGTPVTLSASADPGFVFTGWSGACSGSNATCVVTMDATKSVTATFTAQYTLFVTTLGSGTVTAQPASTSWKYLAGTPVTLSATANPGFVFASWSGACSGSNTTCVVTMDVVKSVTATFTVVQYTLNVSKVGSGTITAQPASTTGKYDAGTVVTLTATPDPGFQFAGWTNSNPCSGTGPCVVTMNGDKSETASFTAVQYTLNVSKVGSGTVTAQPASATGKYNAGAVVTLTATPDPGFQFAGWTNSNPCSGTGPCVVTMNGDRSESATFTALPPPPPPPPAPTTCDDKIGDLEKKVAADKHPWRHDHQLKAALRLYAADLIELPNAKAKVGASDRRYVRAWKEFTDGKAALCGGRYWHAHHDLWDAYYIAHEILKQHRR